MTKGDCFHPTLDWLSPKVFDVFGTHLGDHRC